VFVASVDNAAFKWPKSNWISFSQVSGFYV
jgi:hypothetical protein